MQALKTQFRVMSALILREARTRHGRNRLGYLWSIIQPVSMILVLTAIFGFVGRGGGIPHFGTFFAIGVITFNMFRGTASYVANAHDANKPLFNYPMVKPLDTTFSRLILDMATTMFVGVLVIGFQVIALDAPAPHDLPAIMLPLFAMAWMALGVGLTLTSIKRFAPSIMQLYAIIMGPMFLLSGVLFPVSTMPEPIREVLLWNPFLHGVELARVGYYVGYRDDGLSINYLLTWGTCMNFVGFISERISRFRME